MKFDLKTEKFDLSVLKGIEGAAGKAAAAGYINNKGTVFLFGGRSMSGRTNEMFSYNPVSSIWEEEKPGGFLPPARSFIASTNWNDSFLIFGGQGPYDYLRNNIGNC